MAERTDFRSTSPVHPPVVVSDPTDDDLDAILEAALEEMPPEKPTSHQDSGKMEALERTLSEFMTGLPTTGSEEEQMIAMMQRIVSNPSMAQQMISQINEVQPGMLDPTAQMMECLAPLYSDHKDLCRLILSQKAIPGSIVFKGLQVAKEPFFFLVENMDQFQSQLQDALMPYMREFMTIDQSVSARVDAFVEKAVQAIVEKTDAKKLTQSEAIEQAKGQFPLVRTQEPIEENRILLAEQKIESGSLYEIMLHDPQFDLERTLAVFGACLENPLYKGLYLKAQSEELGPQFQLMAQGGRIDDETGAQIDQIEKTFGSEYEGFHQAVTTCLLKNYHERQEGARK